MARLVYASIASLDGFVADAGGDFGWAAPDEEVHAFVNEIERPLGLLLYGRRMYEVMRAWETMDVTAEGDAMRDFAALWRAAEKIVYSRTLDAVETTRTRLEREFDPAAVRALKRSASTDIGIGGPGLAGAALAAGLIDEIHAIVVPAIVGGGTPFLPAGLRLDLRLLDTRRFANGMLHAHYATAQ